VRVRVCGVEGGGGAGVLTTGADKRFERVGLRGGGGGGRVRVWPGGQGAPGAQAGPASLSSPFRHRPTPGASWTPRVASWQHWRPGLHHCRRHLARLVPSTSHGHGYKALESARSKLRSHTNLGGTHKAASS
jgi:hypothetical protein